MIVDGLLLAAGAGSRMGRPKALVVGDDGTPWLRAALGRLHDGGCRSVTVVLGAAADEAATLVDRADVHVVVAADWAEGMSASLRAGLASLDPSADAALVTLVDLPDVTEWYRGGPADQVTVDAPPTDMQALVQAADFQAGQRYLVSANDGFVTVCGFTAAYSDDLAALYAEAFGAP